MQIAGLDPEGGYNLFKELIGIDADKIDDFEIDDIWVFLEGVFSDFFPSRVRESIPKLLKGLKEQVVKSIEEQFSVLLLQMRARCAHLSGKRTA